MSSLCQESKPSTSAFINLISKIVEENHDVQIPPLLLILAMECHILLVMWISNEERMGISMKKVK